MSDWNEQLLKGRPGLEVVESWVDEQSSGAILQVLKGILTGWKIYPSRADTIIRRETALLYYDRVRSEPVVWLADAKRFLKQTARDKQEDFTKLCRSVARRRG